MKTRLSSKQMLLDITSMRSQAKKLLRKDKSYYVLLRVLLEKDYFYNEDLPFPTLKEICQRAGINDGKARKQLQMIYHDLTDYDVMKPFNFNKVEYLFTIKTKENYQTFVADSLPVIPRIGESIRIPYFKAHLGTNYFFVENIQYSLEDQKQQVVISLKEGSYNLYWHFRKDQAQEEGEINYYDLYKLDDYQLKAKLRIGHHGKSRY